MGVALYRKYRSSKLEDVIGQDHITSTVNNMVASGNIPHAFLLTGPRGVGKTSVARLIACMVNDVKYEDLDSQIDIIEIDAASNRKIDEIREIREQVNIVPTSLKYKVYIIDEVHMLTREAFNALLKTLEEPPEHVIFILATTEFHKLPPTIISRCIRFAFKPISVDDISKHLLAIAKKEKIDIENDAIEAIAIHSEGSFRDGITLLENFRTFNAKVSEEDVEINLGVASQSVVDEIVSAIKNSDKQQIYKLVDGLQYSGVNYSLLAKDLSARFRDSLINDDNIVPNDKIIELLDGLLEVQASSQPKQKLVITLLGSVTDKTPPQINETPEAVEQEPKVNIEPEPVRKPVEPVPEIQSEPEKEIMPQSPVKGNTGSIDELWLKTLETLKVEQNTIYAISRMGKIASFTDDKLTIEFKFPFHAKRMSDDRNKQMIEKYLSNSSGKSIKILFSVAGEPTEEKHIQNISNIFGPSEVLE
ncbi:MAG: DNA polymerase III subunit gamma/tau [Patescibacteria group bacterium]